MTKNQDEKRRMRVECLHDWESHRGLFFGRYRKCKLCGAYWYPNPNRVRYDGISDTVRAQYDGNDEPIVVIGKVVYLDD
jgi:hypothetical protein